MVGPAEDGQVSLPATMLDTFRRWCYYPARYFGVCERDIRQLINTFVAPVSREVPIAPNGGSRVGGTSAPDSGGPTWFRPTAASLRSHPPRSGPGGFFLSPETKEKNRCRARKRRGPERKDGASAVRPSPDRRPNRGRRLQERGEYRRRAESRVAANANRAGVRKHDSRWQPRRRKAGEGTQGLNHRRAERAKLRRRRPGVWGCLPVSL